MHRRTKRQFFLHPSIAPQEIEHGFHNWNTKKEKNISWLWMMTR